MACPCCGSHDVQLDNFSWCNSCKFSWGNSTLSTQEEKQIWYKHKPYLRLIKFWRDYSTLFFICYLLSYLLLILGNLSLFYFNGRFLSLIFFHWAKLSLLWAFPCAITLSFISKSLTKLGRKFRDS